MADKKISALTAATTPLDGTEVLPIVQSGSTVKVANNDLRPKQIQSNATSGVLQIAGPSAASTRVMTTPDANFTAARTDAAQSFTGLQTFNDGATVAANKPFVVNASGAVWNFPATNGVSLNTGYGATMLKSVNAGGNDNDFYYTSGQHIFGNSTTEYFRFDSNGNLIPKTAAKGVNFTANTPAAGMTSQLLNWYEEGTWTPADASGAGLSLTATGTYTRIGRMVMAQFSISYPSTASTANTVISGLPFGVALDGGYAHTYTSSNTAPCVARSGGAGSTSFNFLNYNFSSNITNNQLSGTNTQGTYIYFI